MVSTRTTKQSIGLIISMPILVGAISVCSHISIALADSTAYAEAQALTSSYEIARYIEQSPIQDLGDNVKHIYLPSQRDVTSMPEKNLDLVKYKTEVFTFEGNNQVKIT